MILLEPGNKVLGDTILQQFNVPTTKTDDDTGKTTAIQRDPLLVTLCDYDDTSYKVSVGGSAMDILIVSMRFPPYKHIKPYGSDEALKAAYSSHLVSKVEDTFDVTLYIPLDEENIKTYLTQNYAEKVSRLKNIAVSGVYIKYFTALANNASLVSQPLKYEYRSDTTIYIIPKADRVTIVFEFEFSDKVDRALAKVFLAEFVESKRRLGAAPPCTFSTSTLLEVQQAFNLPDTPSSKLGFLSFAVMPVHVSSAEKITKISNTLSLFRNYLQYHLKSSKTYFHMRMRQRVNSMMQVLNRAKIEFDDGKGKEKKTISGKTFMRQG